MSYLTSVYLILGENRSKELEHFTTIITQNFATVLVNSFTNLHDLQKQLSNEIVMAPDYIFLEDQSIDNETYYMLRKFFKLEKASRARIVVFGPNVHNIMKRRSDTFRWKLLEIKEYETMDLEKTVMDIKQLFVK